MSIIYIQEIIFPVLVLLDVTFKDGLKWRLGYITKKNVRKNMKIMWEIKRTTAKEKQYLDLYNYQNTKRNEVR